MNLDTIAAIVAVVAAFFAIGGTIGTVKWNLAQSKNTTRRTEFDILEGTVAAVSARLAAVRVELGETIAELKQVKIDLHLAEARIKGLEAENGVLTEALERARGQIGSLQMSLGKAKKRIGELGAENRRLAEKVQVAP